MKLAINAMMTRPGGALTVLLGMLKAWRQIGTDFDIHVLASRPDTLEALSRQIPSSMIEALLPGAGPVRRAWWQSARLPRWLDEQDIDVLLTNNHYLPAVRCPQVVHHHNLWRFVTPDLGIPAGRGMLNRLRDWSARRALSQASANVFVSDFLRRQAEACTGIGGTHHHVIPNCVPDDEIDRSAPISPTLGRNQILAVQNANPHKDNPTLLRSLAELVTARPKIDWQLCLAGGSGRADWQPLRDLAAKLGIDARIQWLGFLPMAQLRQLQQQSLCQVSTSRFESSGLTILEAMAAAVPTVATRIPAFVEYAGPAALLADPAAPHQFAEAILQLHDNSLLRERQIAVGRDRLEQYRWSTWAPRFAEILQTAASGRGK